MPLAVPQGGAVTNRAGPALRWLKAWFGQLSVGQVLQSAVAAITLAAAIVAITSGSTPWRWAGVGIGGLLVLALALLAAREFDRSRYDRRALVRDMRKVLTSVVRGDGHPFLEEMTIHYVIGTSAKGDRVHRRMTTRAAEGHLLRWRTIKERLPDWPGARRLTPRRVKLTMPGLETRHHRLVPLESDRDTLYLCVAFLPPIEGTEAVEWSMSYRWPGVWNRLRQHGEDHQSLALLSGPFWTRLEVIFDFPPGTTDIRFTQELPPGGQPSSGEVNGRPRLGWVSEAPQVGRFRFDFAANVPKRAQPVES